MGEGSPAHALASAHGGHQQRSPNVSTTRAGTPAPWAALPVGKVDHYATSQEAVGHVGLDL
jgi:hypothetical protein